MRRFSFWGLFILLLTCNSLFAKPVFTQSKYLIAVLSDDAIGTVSPGTVSYPLVYYSHRNDETALTTDYWIIEEQGNNQYSFRNAATFQYIRYDNSVADRTALILVNSLAADKSTLFTLELHNVNNQPYYMIRSVINPSKVWNKRGTAYDSLYPVGVYDGSGSNNELFIFYDSDGEGIIDDAMGNPGSLLVHRSLGIFQNYADSLSFDSQVPVVDTPMREFFLTIREARMGSNLTMNIRYKLKNDTHKLFINNKPVSDGEDFNFGTVSASSAIPIQIRYNTSLIASGTLYFTCIPLVQVYTEGAIGTVYNRAGLVVAEPAIANKPEIVGMNIKIRGAMASGLPKKAFAVKLKDTDGVTSVDRSFFGLRNDNNWILDAMYIDPARMRNRVSTDLWNDFSVKPYFYSSEPDLINGTRGVFVEVFINDAYQGLYCMTEKVDRKQLKLKKINDSYTPPLTRGGLYKGKDWQSGTFGGNLYWDGVAHFLSTAYNNKSDWWSGFQVKYPKIDDGEPIDWKPLVDAITVSSHLTNDAFFRANIANHYDLPVYLDYYLFIELLLASDNHGKNTYLSVYDQTKSIKFTITPWDLDGTWGRRWEGSSDATGPNQNFDNFITYWEHGHNNLFLRLKSLNYDNYNNKLINRYRELRDTYFSFDNLMSRFETYFNLFEKSGAGTRERNKWGVGNFSSEKTFISNWISARLNYLDNQYLGGPFTSIYSNIKTTALIAPNPVVDVLTISNLSGINTIQVFSLQGSMIFSIRVSESEVKVNMSQYAPGTYILKIGDKAFKILKK